MSKSDSNMKSKVMIYGASGYMGRMFTEYVKKQQQQQPSIDFVLAGRTPFTTTDPVRIFALDNHDAILEQLRDVLLVVNLAGPFAKTNRPLIEACIANQSHYIDIAGEAAEMATAYEYHDRAVAAGIMLMPGAGFGIVPTDLVANLAARKLSNSTATHLTIGFVTVGGASRGTLQTVLKDIHKPGIVVENGQQVEAMPACKSFSIPADINGTKHDLVYNPWRADLFTAHVSTKIPNIETYSSFPSLVVSMMKGKWLWLRDFVLGRLIGWIPIGPSLKELEQGSTLCYAEVRNADTGETAGASIAGPEAYVFTAYTLLHITQRIMSSLSDSGPMTKVAFQPGFQTPNLYGVDLLDGIPKVVIDA